MHLGQGLDMSAYTVERARLLLAFGEKLRAENASTKHLAGNARGDCRRPPALPAGGLGMTNRQGIQR
jgi:hypothetical protein